MKETRYNNRSRITVVVVIRRRKQRNDMRVLCVLCTYDVCPCVWNKCLVLSFEYSLGLLFFFPLDFSRPPPRPLSYYLSRFSRFLSRRRISPDIPDAIFAAYFYPQTIFRRFLLGMTKRAKEEKVKILSLLAILYFTRFKYHVRKYGEKRSGEKKKSYRWRSLSPRWIFSLSLSVSLRYSFSHSL